MSINSRANDLTTTIPGIIGLLINIAAVYVNRAHPGVIPSEVIGYANGIVLAIFGMLSKGK